MLNDHGYFVGFDVVIGNPPYMLVFEEKMKLFLEQSYPEFKRNNDLYVAFFNLGFSILSVNANFSFITPNTFIKGDYFKSLRNFLAGENFSHNQAWMLRDPLFYRGRPRHGAIAIVVPSYSPILLLRKEAAPCDGHALLLS